MSGVLLVNLEKVMYLTEYGTTLQLKDFLICPPGRRVLSWWGSVFNI
jgi:hypothetical protein